MFAGPRRRRRRADEDDGHGGEDRRHGVPLGLQQRAGRARAGAGWRSASSPTRCGTGSWSRRTRRARSPRRGRRPAISGRRRCGTVIVPHARVGVAPSVAAASCRWGRCRAGRAARRARRTGRRPAPGRRAPATTSRASRPARASNVISRPKPIVTADVAIGSISPVSSSRPAAAGGGDGERGEHADDDGDHRGHDRRAQRRADGGERVDAEVDARAHLGPAERAPAAERVAVAGRAASARRSATSGATTTAAVADGDADDEARSRPGRGGRRRAQRTQGEGPAVATLLPRRPGHAGRRRPTSCSTASVAAAPRSPSWVAWRQISTSIVDVAGVAEDADHAERREREHEDDRRRRRGSPGAAAAA